MKIHTLTLGENAENCYVIETTNKNAVIVDCGDEAGRILSFLEKNGLTAKKILLTHGHFDHMNAVSEITDVGSKISSLGCKILNFGSDSLYGFMTSS